MERDITRKKKSKKELCVKTHTQKKLSAIHMNNSEVEYTFLLRNEA